MLRSARRAAQLRPAPVRAQVRSGCPSVASLYSQVPLRQENAYLLDRRALQRQRLASSGASCRSRRLGRLRRDGPRAGGEGSTRSTSAPPSSAATRWREMNEVDPPLHRRGERAAGDRLHRDAGARGGAEAAMAASRSSTRSTSRTARSRPTSAWSWRKQFGAAVIALTIDESGMAKTAEDKLRSPSAWSISPATSTACRSPTC